MPTRYDDIVKIRGGKAAYNIAEETDCEWETFIPNEQFNAVLRTVIRSVRGNDIDNHKSFWINGTYGTGKSHAVAVVSHLLGDDYSQVAQWVKYEYGAEKFATMRAALSELRKERRLLTVKLYGLQAMSHASDLAPVLQKAVKQTLADHQVDLQLHTDFEAYIEQIERNPEIWDHLIDTHPELNSMVATRQQLVANLKADDLATYNRVTDVLRESGLDVRLDNSSLKQWMNEVDELLRQKSCYTGMLLVWDEFTDVMTDAIGLAVLKGLQELAELFMNADSGSYFFLISHPSAFDKLGSEQMKQTDGRYHRMKYNMEMVSAFKIMSRKFEVLDRMRHRAMYGNFYAVHPELLDVFTSTSNDPASTRDDLYNLFPLHPGTANLATHYATVVGSSSRSVFEFLGQNEAIRDFLDSPDRFLNRDTITADYLWDYVAKVFQDDVLHYGAVTERYNSYVRQVDAMGDDYLAVFKGILLLNAFNNVSGEANNGLVTPSEENIKNLFAGSCHEGAVNEVLEWLNREGIIQRAPGGIYSVQFSALPSGEIEAKKTEMRQVQFRFTHQVAEFGQAGDAYFGNKMMQRVIRPYGWKWYSDEENEATLRSKIKNGRKAEKASHLWFALLVARNHEELARLHAFAERFVADDNDKDLKHIVLVVMDEVLGEMNYERFIEYQANYASASSHGFVDQVRVHRDHAIGMVRDWMESMARGNATLYINGQQSMSFSVKQLSRIVNAVVAPSIFSSAPDAIELLRQKSPFTFWKPQNSKEAVRTMLFAQSKADFEKLNAQMRPIQYMVQDCLDDNLEWVPDCEHHAFKETYDRVNKIIKYADKSLPFNFADKFAELSKPPYGFYGNYATMATLAFALRPWVGKIFDPQGKPRDANALVDDIVALFKVWDEGRSSAKLNFKFQTPEEGKLCKALIGLFSLGGKDSQYKDVTSLKDARYAIVSDFLGKKGAPLWVLKYVTEVDLLKKSPDLVINDDMRHLIDNIVRVCTETDLRNPALVTETDGLISRLRIDMKNVLNLPDIFSDGLRSYLMQLPDLCLKKEEVEPLLSYVEQNLQSSVGYWSEEEVYRTSLRWAVTQRNRPEGAMPTAGQPARPVTVAPQPADEDVLYVKRVRARDRIFKLTSLEQAKQILFKLCDEKNEWLLDLLRDRNYV